MKNVHAKVLFSAFLSFLFIGLFVTSVSAGQLLQYQVTEARVIELTNAERAKHGLNPVNQSDCLTNAALWHARQMLEQDFFSHNDNQGRLAGDRVARVCRNLVGLTGENIFQAKGKQPDQETIAQMMIKGWMQSPLHRKNILKPGYDRIGVSVLYLDGTIRAVQVFNDVKAWLNQNAPQKVRRGRTIRLTGSGTSSLGNPDECEIFNVRANKTIAGPYPVNAVKMDAPRGIYRLRFRFNKQTGDVIKYTIVPGPDIEIQ